MKRIFIPLAVIIILVGVIFTIKTQKFSPPIIENKAPIPETPVTAEKIKNLNLNSGTTLSNTYTIKGEAAGLYFEGSFPIFVKNITGQTVYTFIGQANGDWMTTDFVPFEAIFNTTLVPNGNYTLEFTQDDPSGGESGKPIYVYSLPIIITN